MTLHSLRSTWTATVLGFISAALLTSCGGGGASTGTTGGALTISPATATMYGGVPATFSILGGRPAYQLSSSEPALLPVPTSTTSNSITLLAANPGVVNSSTVPASRVVTLTARDTLGNSTTATVNVSQNFLTGYGATFTSSCPASTSSTSGTVNFCAGGDTLMTFAAVTNGNLFGGREFRLEVVSGPITILNPATGASGNSVNVTSDHNGNVQAIIRVAPNVATQFAVFRIVDIATGASTQQVVTIVGGSSTATLTALPSAFTFTGPDDQTCGTGQGEFAVFDGQPPYTAIASDSNLTVQYVDPNHNPGLFIVRAFNPNVCITNGTVIITDAANARTTVTVTTNKGSTPATVPPTPLQVQPGSLTLSCGQTGSVLAVGGGSSSSGSGGSSSASYSAASTNPNIRTAVTGNTISITAFFGAAAGAGTGSSTYTVNVTDGSQIVPVTVTAPTTCP